MIRRNTWITLAIFVLLAGSVIYLQRRGTFDQAEPTPTTQPSVFEVNQADIDQFSIQDFQGDQAVLSWDESDGWTLIQPQVELDDPSLINQAGNQVTSIRILSTLESPPSLEALGLDQPAYTIILNLNNGIEIVVDIGNVTPTDSGYYVQKSDGPIQIAAKFNLDTLIELMEEATKVPEEPEAFPTPTQ